MDYLIVCGRNGVICFEDIFKNKENKENQEENENNENGLNIKHTHLIKDKTFRNIIQIDDYHQAFTSNEVLPSGENKLIIYNLSIRDTKEEIKGYSYAASTNGLAIIKLNNKIIILCA